MYTLYDYLDAIEAERAAREKLVTVSNNLQDAVIGFLDSLGVGKQVMLDAIGNDLPRYNVIKKVMPYVEGYSFSETIAVIDWLYDHKVIIAIL